MPIFLYSNPKTNKVIEVIQSVHDKHEYIDKNGLKWQREFTIPHMSIDAVNIDPFNSKDYVKATNKKGTIGDLMDRSKELSIKREEKAGIDDLKETHYKNYSKRRNGRVHPTKRAEIVNSILGKEIELKIK